MSIKELNSTEIEQVSGGTFLLTAFLIKHLLNNQGSGWKNTQNQPLTSPENNLELPCSPISDGISRWFRNLKI